MKTYEITYVLINSSNSALQRTIIQASDTVMARRIFEQQNPGCRIAGSPREIR